MTRNTKLWFAVFVAVVFVTGALAGVVVDRRWRPEPAPEAFLGPQPDPNGNGPRGRGPLPPAQAAEINVARLDRLLVLTAEQRAAILEVLRRRDERVRELQTQARDQFVSEQRALQDDIERLLTPEQQARFRTLRGRLLGPAGGRAGPLGRADGRGGRRGRE